MKFTGMSADEVERATNRDTFMTPEQAMEVCTGAGSWLCMACF